MQRYFVDSAQMSENRVQLKGEDARHFSRVMRGSPGDRFVASDGKTRDVLAEATHVEGDTVTATVIEDLPRVHEPDIEVWVAQSLPKADKMETVIQKCTELGATRFLPFCSERTIVRYDRKKEERKLERWRKIAKEAAEQAGRNRVPEVEPPLSWKELLDRVKSVDLALLCYEHEDAGSLKSALRSWKAEHAGDSASGPPRLMLLTGPEGGFAPEEVREAAGARCRSVGLGKRILRTETAALAALACVLYEFDEMEG